MRRWRRDDEEMTGATRAVGRLLALGAVGLTGGVLVAAPAHARPADTPPITLPPSSSADAPVPTTVPGVPAVAVPPLQQDPSAPAGFPDLLQGTGGVVGSLPAPPAPPRPPAAASAPGASPVPAPDGSPAVAPVPAPRSPPPAVASSPRAAPVPRPEGQPEPVPSPAEALARAARSFTPLFVLAAAVVAFLVVQGRVDRNEAKLTTASIDGDELEFR